MENATLPQAISNATIDLHINPVFKAIGFLTCFWIIIAHSGIVFCFIINRSKPWTNYSKQILSLSLNDLHVGLACLFLLVLFSLEAVNIVSCSFSFYFFFAALCASLYHVLAICIYRALTLIRKPTNTVPTSLKLSVLLVFLAWVASFCLCAVPFILWGEQRQDIPSCQVDFVFGDQQEPALGFFAICYILPMIFTNVVYAVTCCKLLMVWRKVFPTAASEDAACSTQNATDTLSHSNRSGVKVQRRTIGTIGLLLAYFNLFSLPMVVIMCAEYSGKTFPRNVRTLASNVFILNSVISPFVYAIRTKFLRKAMKDLGKDCFSCVIA